MSRRNSNAPSEGKTPAARLGEVNRVSPFLLSDAPKSLPTLRWAAGGLLVLGILSRILGLAREVISAYLFGVSAQLDSLYLGMSLPAVITLALGSGLVRAGVAASAGLATERLAGLATTGVWRLAKRLIPYSLILAVLTSLIAWYALATMQVVALPLIMACVLGSLTLVGVGMAGMLSGIANARGNHVGSAVTPLVYNVVLILTIVLTHAPFGVLSICFGFFLAEWVQVLCYKLAVGKDVRLAKPKFEMADYQAWMHRFWPAAFAALLMGANLVIDRFFTVRLGEGATAALSYSDKLINMPAGLLGVALAVPLFTRLSRYRAQGREAAYRVTLLLGIRLLLVAGIPISVLVLFMAEPIVAIILQRGAFDVHAVSLCSQALRGYALGMPFIAMSLLLIGASLTTKNPWRLVWWLFVSVLLNTLLNAVLSPRFGVAGIAMSTSIVAVFRVVVLLQLVSPQVLSSLNLRKSFAGIMLAVLPGGLMLGLYTWYGDANQATTLWERLTVVGVGGLIFTVCSFISLPLIRRELASLGRMRTKAAQANGAFVKSKRS
ncbi:MAG: murein biosynthesis integral membrane protein MurJ [Sumerlaeia bacterium]